MGGAFAEDVEIVAYRILCFGVRGGLCGNGDDGKFEQGDGFRRRIVCCVWKRCAFVAWDNGHLGVAFDVGSCLVGDLDVLEGELEGEAEFQQVQRVRLGVLAHSVYRRNTFGDVSLRASGCGAGDVFGDFVCLYSETVGAEGNRSVFREMTSHTPTLQRSEAFLTGRAGSVRWKSRGKSSVG